ncbi:hypothetical protein FT641_19850 [Bacillus paranthracis]|uniref:hypothetical protein n=1 Tax=Bacillus paranthracis TaxID=2026186 RepID=UPI00187ADE35|nr:hypothetical protein [Bacillus paranthracis]MBE7114684.1 hypothetical protein [Bacillus paranthracis]MBE7154949.1 hypothetical protein [Bacillus paranthracis]
MGLGFFVLACFVGGLAVSGAAGVVTGICWIIGSVAHIELPYNTIFRATGSTLILILVICYKWFLDRDIL